MNLDIAARLIQNARILDALIEGITSEQFTALVDEEFPKMTTAERGVWRMNIIGGLRAMGYDVSGGRKGGDYKILGFSKPIEKKVDWSEDQLARLKWFDSLETVDSHGYNLFELATSRHSSDTRHENTWLYTWCYELTGGLGNRSTGKWFSGDAGGLGIIKRTFKERPTFSVIDVSLSAETLKRLIISLSTVSLRPVKVVNIRFSTLPELLTLVPGDVERVSQSIYDVAQIAEHPETYFSSQSWKTARKMLREVTFEEVPWNKPRIPDQRSVIDDWRVRREASQARPALTRDYVASDLDDYPGKISVVGYRDGYPVSYRVIDRLVNNPTIGADILEKSLNSSQDPGGHSGISDASLVNICRVLTEKGILLMNGGESLSVGPLLAKFKHKFERPDLKMSSMTFVSKLPYFKQ